MKTLWRWVRRGLVLVLVGVLALLGPVVWVETTCRGPVQTSARVPLVAPEWHRPASRSVMTYPEWHIVHAYEDYAAVIATGAPQDFAFLPAIGQFWGSLCRLTKVAATQGGVDGPTRQMNYTIGVSFTAELLAKAAYEETLGRLFTALRGPDRAPLDDLSADQAARYAAFLSQVPWYRWDFLADKAALQAASTGNLRDRERALALGIEYGVKARYAAVIAAAVAATGQDELRMRVIVTGLSAETLAASPDVTVIATRAQGIEVETPRYAAFTDLARTWAAQGGGFVEIAGNDQIMFTALSDQATRDGALASFPRQGRGDFRHLILIDVGKLAAALNDPSYRVEHIHDY